MNMKKVLIFLSALALMLPMITPYKAQAGNGLAVTGVVLGASALALAGYNTYQIRRSNRYYDQRGGYYQPVAYNRRRPCRPNYNGYYQPANAYHHGGGYYY